MRNFLNYKFFVFLHTIYRISVAKLKARKNGKKWYWNDDCINAIYGSFEKWDFSKKIFFNANQSENFQLKYRMISIRCYSLIFTV